MPGGVERSARRDAGQSDPACIREIEWMARGWMAGWLSFMSASSDVTHLTDLVVNRRSLSDGVLESALCVSGDQRRRGRRHRRRLWL